MAFFSISLSNWSRSRRPVVYRFHSVWIAADLTVPFFVHKFVPVYLGMYSHPGLGSKFVSIPRFLDSHHRVHS